MSKLHENWLKKHNYWQESYKDKTTEEIVEITHKIQHERDKEYYIVSKAKHYLTSK